MKSNEHDEKATLSRDGITIRQVYNQESFDIPTVRLTLVSDRKEPVHVRISLDLTADIDVEEVGFHPDYRRDNWVVEDGQLKFETELEPDGEVTTIYAVDSLQSSQIQTLFDNLAIDHITSSTDEAIENDQFTPHKSAREDTVSVGDGGSRDAPQSEDRPDIGVESEESDTSKRDVSNDDEEEMDVSHGTSEETSGVEKPETTGVPGDGDETRKTKIEDTQAKTIDEHEMANPDVSSDLSASSISGLVSELGQRLERFEGRMTQLEERMTILEGDVEDVPDSLDKTTDDHEGSGETGIESPEELAEVIKQVRKVDEGTAVTDENANDLESRLSSLETEIEKMRETISEHLDEFEPRLRAIEEDSQARQKDDNEQTQTLESRLNLLEEDIRSIEHEQAKLRSDVSKLLSWRENLQTMFESLKD